MIKIVCSCGETYFADEQHVGKTIKCKNCGDILPIVKPQEISKKSNSNWERKYLKFYFGVVILIIGVSIFFIIYSSFNKKNISRPNGELDNSFAKENVKISKLSEEQKFQEEKNKLIADGWTEQNIQNGQLPDCYNFKPQKGNIKNYLEVKVGGGTDVAIKVMNLETNKCVRYFYVNSGTTYTTNNIPTGKYYLKIAYGKNWLSKILNKQCVGKFIQNPLYKKGVDVFDFSVEHLSDRDRTGVYSLELDVVQYTPTNSFSTQSISETEFNQ